MPPLDMSKAARDKIFNDAMLRLTERAGLESHPISRAIVCELLKHDCVKFGDLLYEVTRSVNCDLSERNLRRHIEFTNEKFRLINNLDIKEQVTLAQIYEITVEFNDQFFTRIALVHNVR